MSFSGNEKEGVGRRAEKGRWIKTGAACVSDLWEAIGRQYRAGRHVGGATIARIQIGDSLELKARVVRPRGCEKLRRRLCVLSIDPAQDGGHFLAGECSGVQQWCEELGGLASPVARNL